MFVGIINNYGLICLLDNFNSKNRKHHSLCGEIYSKNKFNIISFNQTCSYSCKECLKTFIGIFGSIDDNLSFNINQQNIILSQDLYKTINKGKRLLSKKNK